jgi:hypothetical protein
VRVPRPPADAPWKPVDLKIRDVAAIQALAKGEAQPEQQQRALNWIIEVVSGTYDQSYRPNSERDTVFAEGKRWVGNTLVKATKINTEILRKRDV